MSISYNDNNSFRVRRYITPTTTPDPASGGYLLDQFGGAAAAYSLRRLSSAYTGPAVQVRRSSDNAEETFAPEQISNGSLASWVGSGNDGYVTAWYDQSGSGRNATMTTSSRQPRIVNTGSLETQNSAPALRFDGSNDYLEAGDDEGFYSNTDGMTLVAVSALSQPGGEGNVVISKWYSQTDSRAWGIYTDGFQLSDDGTDATASSVFLSPRSNAHSISFASWAPGSGPVYYRNGTLVGTGSAINHLTDFSNRVLIGSINEALFGTASGTIQEIVVYAADLDGSSATFASLLNAFYKVY